MSSVRQEAVRIRDNGNAPRFHLTGCCRKYYIGAICRTGNTHEGRHSQSSQSSKQTTAWTPVSWEVTTPPSLDGTPRACITPGGRVCVPSGMLAGLDRKRSPGFLPDHCPSERPHPSLVSGAPPSPSHGGSEKVTNSPAIPHPPHGRAVRSRRAQHQGGTTQPADNRTSAWCSPRVHSPGLTGTDGPALAVHANPLSFGRNPVTNSPRDTFKRSPWALGTLPRSDRHIHVIASGKF